ETKSFKGETGPYLQYAHTRLCGLVRQYGKAVPDQVDASLLLLPEEVALAKLVGSFPDVVRRAAEEYEPSIVSGHLLDVSAAFNRYYHAGKLDGSMRIITPDEAKTAARMRLSACVRHVLAAGLRLLGVEPLEEM
ncbi:MAG: DALR anticodon-binding domain-containing protein, partial [Planctomycetota bacterium]